MSKEQLAALLKAAEATQKGDWWILPSGRHITFYAAFNGASLTVAKVHEVSEQGSLLHLRTRRKEEYILATEDTFAGAIEAPASDSRKAGFV